VPAGSSGSGGGGGDRSPSDRTVATNRRARHDYAIEETFEAGIVLSGPEVKSLRGGRASLVDAFARVRDGEVWVENLHIPPYEMADARRRYEPTRPRKLLLHRREIERLVGKTAERGLTLVPLRIYFTRGIAKMELGLGRGKRRFEKRDAIAEREHRREVERAMAVRRRGDA
jgi:SsrA-binding protein